MNGSQPPRSKSGDDLSPVLGLPILAFGGMAFWWWQLGHRARTQWLEGIGSASGYGPVPADMVEQIEWLVMHRMNDLYGMFLLFVLTATAGIVEGNARRQAEALSGFGLRRLKFGRALLVVWLGPGPAVDRGTRRPALRPVIGGLLALSLFAALYNLGRGLQRTR